MANNKENLAASIEQALIELKNDYKENQQGSGWHQFFNSDKVGIVASSQAVMILQKYSESEPRMAKAVRFILDHQKTSDEALNDGGWSYITNLSDVANTESTCWALGALYTYPGIANDVKERGLQWLQNNFIQSAMAGWGTVSESGFRTYATCIALQTLKLYGRSTITQYRRSLDTLKRIQRSDGGWGSTEIGSSTLVHTAHCIITLIDSGMSIQSSEIRRGVAWMIRAMTSPVFQSDSYMGYVELIDLRYTFSGKAKSQRINFYHMPLPYAVLALMKAQSTENNLICSIVSRLIKEHQYGRWYHPYLPDTLTMWTMYDVLNMFKEFKDSKYYTNYDQFLYIEPNQPKEKFDVIIFTVVPIEFKTLNKILNFADLGRSEDYKTNGFWYYKYTLIRDGKSSLSCLITMIGSAGDVDCSIACNNAFSVFDCDLAILCGIAAGNRKEIAKYSSVVAENVVAYEYQRWEEDGKVYRPKHYQVKGAAKRGVEKVSLFDKQFISILSTFLNKIDINVSEVENYSSEKARNHVGTIASGAKLLADGRTLQILRENIPVGKGIIAAEMEGSGFAPACEAKDIDWLIFRGISDYGEDDKNNPENKAHQPLAVASAAASMICYLTYVL